MARWLVRPDGNVPFSRVAKGLVAGSAMILKLLTSLYS